MSFAIAPVTIGDAPFELTAYSTSGLDITYSSSTPEVASIYNNILTIDQAGTTTITASQNGNNNYNAADHVQRQLLVQKITSSVQELIRTSLLIYPNPVIEIITVEFPSDYILDDENIELYLFNLTGADLMKDHMRTVRDNVLELDILDMPAGIYILTIPFKETSIKHKITKL